ncbi:uncharacterized protein CEXT_543081 [Caerostris extrusa]|uniref:CUB domain-containing protein n=1 Tax=Caerostris extrusa TaxID=172846 RepID=A0AAV4PZ64_CAEEX|nr:uncharacterized protein CEXT_543081 [Caerostris extrusa]
MDYNNRYCISIRLCLYICSIAIGTFASTEEETLILASALKERDVMYSECGGVLRNSKGVISTPNYPEPYPVPINCRWVIEAPSDKVIAIYFTQFYMREGLTVTEYAFFSETLYMGSIFWRFSFNITYEIVGRNESIRKDACVYHHCSYTGSCYAAAFFTGYLCHCFADFYGAECQYSPGCEPGAESMCLNGGTCR